MDSIDTAALAAAHRVLAEVCARIFESQDCHRRAQVVNKASP
jgi:hypothetical protein